MVYLVNCILRLWSYYKRVDFFGMQGGQQGVRYLRGRVKMTLRMQEKWTSTT